MKSYWQMTTEFTLGVLFIMIILVLWWIAPARAAEPVDCQKWWDQEQDSVQVPKDCEVWLKHRSYDWIKPLSSPPATVPEAYVPAAAHVEPNEKTCDERVDGPSATPEDCKKLADGLIETRIDVDKRTIAEERVFSRMIEESRKNHYSLPDIEMPPRQCLKPERSYPRNPMVPNKKAQRGIYKELEADVRRTRPGTWERKYAIANLYAEYSQAEYFRCVPSGNTTGYTRLWPGLEYVCGKNQHCQDKLREMGDDYLRNEFAKECLKYATKEQRDVASANCDGGQIVFACIAPKFIPAGNDHMSWSMEDY
jgi:hypothetical protein